MRGHALLLLCALLAAGCATQPPAGGTPPTAPSPGLATTFPTTPAAASPAATPAPGPSTDGDRLWTASVNGVASGGPGEPFRYPVLAEDARGETVFLATLSAPIGSDPRLRVVALDAETGARRWTRQDDEEHQHVGTMLHHAGEDLVVVGTDNLTVVALDARTGQPRWASKQGAWGSFTALDVTQGGLVVAAAFDARAGGRAYVAALDPKTGAERWNATSAAGAFAYPNLLAARDGSAVYVLFEEPRPDEPTLLRVAAHEPATGALRWIARPGLHHALAIEMALAPDHATLYVTSRDPTSNVTLHAVSAADGSPRWNATLPVRSVGGLAASRDGALVCAAGAEGEGASVRCLHAANGTQAWDRTARPLHEHRRYEVNGLAFSPQGDRLLLLAAGQSKESDLGLPIAAGGETHLFSYDARTGKPHWTRGWEREDPFGRSSALLVSAHAPRAYVAGEGGSVRLGSLTLDAVGLAR